MQIVLIILFFLFSKEVVGQSVNYKEPPSVTFDNIYCQSIMLPNVEFRDAGVKSVNIELVYNKIKENFMKIRFYDREGYLVKASCWDSSYVIGGENITVVPLTNNSRRVTRKIAYSDFSKGIPIKTHKDFFLVNYLNSGFETDKFPFSDSLEFVDYLHWLGDSSIFYQQYINGQFNDSGKSVQMGEYKGEGRWPCNTEVKLNRNGIKDSIIHCSPNGGTNENYILDSFRIINGFVHSMKKLEVRDKHVIDKREEVYRYDNRGNLMEIDYYGKFGLYLRKSYTISEDNIPIVVTEKYANGKVEQIEISNLKGKLLTKKILPSIYTELEGKEIYVYNERNLLIKEQIWWGEHLTKETTYTYTYFE